MAGRCQRPRSRVPAAARSGHWPIVPLSTSNSRWNHGPALAAAATRSAAIALKQSPAAAPANQRSRSRAIEPIASPDWDCSRRNPPRIAKPPPISQFAFRAVLRDIGWLVLRPAARSAQVSSPRRPADRRSPGLQETYGPPRGRVRTLDHRADQPRSRGERPDHRAGFTSFTNVPPGTCPAPF
jgi:hypothetical protein